MYRLYSAECLRVMTETMAKGYGGSYIRASLADFLDPKQVKVDRRSGEEIADDILEKAGIQVRKGEQDEH